MYGKKKEIGFQRQKRQDTEGRWWDFYHLFWHWYFGIMGGVMGYADELSGGLFVSIPCKLPT